MRNRQHMVSYHRTGRDSEQHSPHHGPQQPSGASPVPDTAHASVSSRPVVDPYEALEVRISWATRVTVWVFMLSCMGAAGLLLWWSVNG